MADPVTPPKPPKKPRKSTRGQILLAKEGWRKADKHARERGYDNIDQLLDDPRRQEK